MGIEQPYYDKNGKEIKEFSLLKVFHFTGARKKKYYMYKFVKILDCVNGTGYYIGDHLDGTNDWFLLCSIADPETRIINSCEIIQEAGE